MVKAGRSWQLLLPAEMDLISHGLSATTGAQPQLLWEIVLAEKSWCLKYIFVEQVAVQTFWDMYFQHGFLATPNSYSVT